MLQERGHYLPALLDPFLRQLYTSINPREHRHARCDYREHHGLSSVPQHKIRIVQRVDERDQSPPTTIRSTAREER